MNLREKAGARPRSGALMVARLFKQRPRVVPTASESGMAHPVYKWVERDGQAGKAAYRLLWTSCWPHLSPPG